VSLPWRIFCAVSLVAIAAFCGWIAWNFLANVGSSEKETPDGVLVAFAAFFIVCVGGCVVGLVRVFRMRP
jgi:hypothetical protein